MRALNEIERDLINAQARLQRAMSALQKEHVGGEWEEYRTADEAVLSLERESAAAKGEEHAIPLEFPAKWDIGAPMPHLLTNDHKCLLIFYLSETTSEWDGTVVSVVDPSSDAPASLALVEFDLCTSAKLGAPNDEVFEGHPLSGKGQAGYAAQEVVNSRWIAEIEAINSVHVGYDPSNWRDARHFIFWFHDSTFECIARSFKIELHNESLPDLLARAAGRLVR